MGKTMNYFACLVRFWREEENTPWRVTLENPHTADKQNFASPEQYWQYMQTILSGPEMDHMHAKRIDND